MTITGHIFLIGLPGSGKSTLGEKLAQSLGLDSVDTDNLMEQRTGKSITQIFDEDGEEQFRRLESEIISELASQELTPSVVALGGGAFQRPENKAAIKAAGVTIYLQNNPRRLVPFLLAKSNRPMLRPEPVDSRTQTEQLEAKLASLLRERKENYETADFVVPCDLLTNQTEQVEAIVKFLQNRYGTD